MPFNSNLKGSRDMKQMLGEMIFFWGGKKAQVLGSEVYIHNCCCHCWWDFGGKTFDHEGKKET